MAICNWCKKEMHTAEGCSANADIEFPDKIKEATIPYGKEKRFALQGTAFDPEPGQKCRDCGAVVGHNHHPGCDWEECPRCNHQLISCGCLDDEEDEEDGRPTLH